MRCLQDTKRKSPTNIWEVVANMRAKVEIHTSGITSRFWVSSINIVTATLHTTALSLHNGVTLTVEPHPTQLCACAARAYNPCCRRALFRASGFPSSQPRPGGCPRPAWAQGTGKSEGVRGVQFIMGLFGKTQEKPPKELVSVSNRGSNALGSGGGNGLTALSGWPPFPGPSTRGGAEGRV